MLVISKDDLRYGYQIRLSDGRQAEIDEDTPQDSANHHETVIVLADGQQETVYTGEVCNPEWYIAQGEPTPIWITTILPSSKSRADTDDVLFTNS